MFSNSKISKWLFYLFILLLPWQTRLILLPHQIEYLSFSIYLSEIVLWLAIGFWLADDYKKIKLPGVFLFFLIFAGLSILWAEDRVAGYRLWLYIFEGILVFLYLTPSSSPFSRGRLGLRLGFNKITLAIKNISPKWHKHQFISGSESGGFIKVFLFSLIFVSGFAIFQFFNLGSEAFKWLGLAERGAWNLGDIVVLGEGGTSASLSAGRWLRAYGPMSHPNILGGYLAVGVLLIFNNVNNGGLCALGRKDPHCYFSLALFLFTLILTFSRSAWLALAIASAYFLFKNLGSREVRKFAMFSLILIAVLGYIFAPFITTRVKSEGYLENKSNIERVASWKEGLVVWKNNPVLGTGLGNYTIGYQVSNSQPAHNIFLLVLAELGIAGFLLYLFIWRKFWKMPSARTILLLFLVIGLFDHYLWTLYSGQMLFWLGLGLIFQEN